ncbi:MAG: DUF2255 family protein [Gordonia polyisoprenivorans]|nr:DUF2255 family protein [Gordonia polyisoprenivorans]
MSTWPADAVHTLAAPQEVHLATRRRDGSLRNPRIIWIVAVDDRIFIRSTNGRSASWFTWAIATGKGQITARSNSFDVTFTEVDSEDDLAAVDRAYRDKYGSYASIVDHLEEPGPRAATLELTPA